MLPLTVPSSLKLAVVCGFPSGKHTTAVKTAEAAESVALGADEIDMVIDIGAAKAGRFDLVEADIASVRSVIPAPGILKVIIESAALTDDEIVAVCEAAVGGRAPRGKTEAGVAPAVSARADFVKTSTGFHPAGGATVEAVALMSKTVAGRAGVKASGGIRSYETAAAMVAAGATRLGVSGSRQVLAEEAGAAAATPVDGAY
jgi:deoxyribose-phosphate aldolase